MPNWTSNSLTIEGEAKDVAAFLTILEVRTGSDGLMHEVKGLLNRLVPMPEILGRIMRGSVLIDGERYEAWTEAERDGETVRTPVTALELDMLSREHGAADWYDWSNAQWGTKWDADAVPMWIDKPGIVRFTFDTAWAPPLQWVAKVSVRFDRLSFRLAYAEQGSGFAGWQDWKRGVMADRWEYDGDFYRPDFDWDANEDDPDAGLIQEISDHLYAYDLHPGG